MKVISEGQSNKDKRIKEHIRECEEKGMSRAEINRELKKNFSVHFKDNPTSKYDKHTCSREREQNRRMQQKRQGSK